MLQDRDTKHSNTDIETQTNLFLGIPSTEMWLLKQPASSGTSDAKKSHVKQTSFPAPPLSNTRDKPSSSCLFASNQASTVMVWWWNEWIEFIQVTDHREPIHIDWLDSFTHTQGRDEYQSSKSPPNLFFLLDRMKEVTYYYYSAIELDFKDSISNMIQSLV